MTAHGPPRVSTQSNRYEKTVCSLRQLTISCQVFPFVATKSFVFLRLNGRGVRFSERFARLELQHRIVSKSGSKGDWRNETT
jgi:hypothetical protein